jgi:hypothetical protein
VFVSPTTTLHLKAATLLATTALAVISAAAPPAVSTIIANQPRQIAVSATPEVERCAIHDDPFFFDTCLARSKR